ncbi:MAG TPA: hypothetical protein VHK69_09140, partial [Chitinophagaceae bacterium]|nr:hypothetical protein [Chitinophagaceae bacterium]
LVRPPMIVAYGKPVAFFDDVVCPLSHPGVCRKIRQLYGCSLHSARTVKALVFLPSWLNCFLYPLDVVEASKTSFVS